MQDQTERRRKGDTVDIVEILFEPLVLLLIVVGVVFAILAKMYTIVPADYADVVIQRGKKKVYSSHMEYNAAGKAAYFKIPAWFFILGLGMVVHRVPLRIMAIGIPKFLAFDSERARFLCNIVAYVVVEDPTEAAKRFGGDSDEMNRQVAKIVQATTRDATTKMAIREIINNRAAIIGLITPPLGEAIKHWGLDLRDIELVEFSDPTKEEYPHEDPPHVIKDISSITEEQINSEARQKNANQKMEARLKEAFAEESAKKREIEKDEEISKREQDKDKMVAERQKAALAEQLEVTKVEQVKNAQIQKEKALVKASQDKEVEVINKEQKHLIGQGDMLMQLEQAKGLAAPIREKGYAEADAKMKLQDALNRFGPDAIRALVAEQLVEMQRAVGIETAKALLNADLKVFAGGGSAEAGFDFGALIESVSVANAGTAKAIMNKIGRPNDLGFKDLMGLITGAAETDPEFKKMVQEAVKDKDEYLGDQYEKDKKGRDE